LLGARVGAARAKDGTVVSCFVLDVLGGANQVAGLLAQPRSRPAGSGPSGMEPKHDTFGRSPQVEGAHGLRHSRVNPIQYPPSLTKLLESWPTPPGCLSG
jgi:hypothetical protein